MHTQDVLNISLSLGILVIAVCLVFITVYLVRALRSITHTAQNISDTTETFRQNLQIRTLTAIPAMLVAIVGRIFKKRR